MVFFVLSKKGFSDIKKIIESGKYSIWVGSEILDEDDIDFIESKDIDYTVFNYTIDQNDIQSSLETIYEHHPNEKVWVEM
ncbi:hypothetical protein tinsulaeT_00320 [Thalassotalea insulae]|uniref:Uncharacterized protein n=2 Tax=Thalassotalea insulae TaxID=2056778 RepID=A0ABQ6GL85_9GAMM|nr:hypothetical protein tinsulaeT_00320 [Thalassotalea insulae]